MKAKTYNPRTARIVWGYIVAHPTHTDIAITADRQTAKEWRDVVMPDETMPQFDLVPRNEAAVEELARLRRMRRKEAE